MMTALKALSITLIFATQLATAATRPFRVVIDPGHGGEDEGTVYLNGSRKVAEKDLTLALARDAAKALMARGVDVLLTRNTDKEVPLADRTALANRMKADVFLSIHLNSTKTHSNEANGIETFILNNTTDASSRRLAKLENSLFKYTAADTPTEMDVAMILRDLKLDANLSESKRLACAVQKNLVEATSSRNRGVRQALFHVLLGAEMPSILLEAGFLNHHDDRIRVLSPHKRRQMSLAIADAITQYRRNVRLGSCKIN